MASNNEKSGKGIIIILLLLIVGLLIGVLASNNSHSQPTSTSTASSPTTTSNSALQDCMNQAHQQWDGVIATSEGTPGNAYEFDKSQLDQRLVQCHQQYGY